MRRPGSIESESGLQKTTRRVEIFLEWDLRRINVYFHSKQAEFNSLEATQIRGGFAFFKRDDSTIHLSPNCRSKENFDLVSSGHELVHAIFFQKYKGAIPLWLEEGLANYIGRIDHPNYRWLASQDLGDITKLVHPNSDATGSKFHYEFSTAAIEMIASKCSLKDLLQLSVGSKLTTYLSTYCKITDVNSDLRGLDSKQGRQLRSYSHFNDFSATKKVASPSRSEALSSTCFTLPVSMSFFRRRQPFLISS